MPERLQSRRERIAGLLGLGLAGVIVTGGCSFSPSKAVAQAGKDVRGGIAPAPKSDKVAKDAPSPPPSGSRPLPKAAPPPPDRSKDASTPEGQRFWAEIVQARKAGNFAGAARLLDQLLAIEPNHRQALITRAEILQDQAAAPGNRNRISDYLQSAALMRRLRSTYKELTLPEVLLLGKILYNEACAYALSNQSGRALDSLAESAFLGPLMFDNLDADPDLDSLRALDRFQTIRSTMERAAQDSARKQAQSALARSKPSPFAFQGIDLDGQTINTANFQGEVLVINIWSTRCLPCRQTLASLGELRRRYQERGLEILGINVEGLPDAEALPAVQAFVKAHEVPFPCILSNEATLRTVVPQLVGLPTLLFIDREGRLRLEVIGYQAPRELEPIVELLLDKNSPAPSAPSPTPAPPSPADPTSNPPGRS
jgi:thiol-disulfide isomerase/thioredoxin